jgi:hypothetical protein
VKQAPSAAKEDQLLCHQKDNSSLILLLKCSFPRPFFFGNPFALAFAHPVTLSQL